MTSMRVQHKLKSFIRNLHVGHSVLTVVSIVVGAISVVKPNFLERRTPQSCSQDGNRICDLIDEIHRRSVVDYQDGVVFAIAPLSFFTADCSI